MSIRFLGLILWFGVLSLTSGAAAQIIEVREDMKAVFDDYRVTGTFVAFDPHRDHMTIISPKRAEMRLIPASTFKIVNALIALETGVVSDENEIIPFGGKPQIIKAWERDMSIRDAVTVSNVPVFQEIARRVGLERYTTYLRKFGFGNQLAGVDVETFWLKGPLKISAVEFAKLLARLARFELPAKVASQKTVRDILRLETRDGAILFGKTGWTSKPNPDVGWFVGWIEKEGRVLSFALNLDICKRSDAAKRVLIAKRLLNPLVFAE